MVEPENRNVLEGVRILDLSHFEAGPSCSLLLAFLGAEAIKIESPRHGKSDRYRFYGEKGNEDIYFVIFNLNKKSITLDIHSEEGRSIFLDLVKKSDVLVENFGTDKMREWGLGEKILRKHNPGLIYGCVRGYGSYGPYSTYPSLDLTAQAMGGVMSMTGHDEDDPPLRSGFAIADTVAGTNLALVITGALYRREKTGQGANVEVSLQDSVVNLGRSLMGTYIAYGSKAPKLGNQLKDVVPWNVYQAKEGGYVAICIINQEMFEKLMDVIGNSHFVEKHDLYSLEKRKQAREEIEKVLGEWVSSRTKHEVMTFLCDHGIPCGAVLDSQEIRKDPHLSAREMTVNVQHHEWGKLKVMGNPLKVHDCPTEIRCSPKLGEHNKEIFSMSHPNSSYRGSSTWKRL
ncbi:CaiB/BaiF CoA transferase family protein [Thermodesulfobacteriota bacterium]